jgi:hypothetical protein
MQPRSVQFNHIILSLTAALLIAVGFSHCSGGVFSPPIRTLAVDRVQTTDAPSIQQAAVAAVSVQLTAPPLIGMTAVSGAAIPVGISPGGGFESIFATLSASDQHNVIALMKADGVRWLRLDYYPTPTKSPFDYQFIKDASQAGINVDVLMNYYSGTSQQFAQAVATMAPLGVHTYEILNEVNGSSPVPVSSYAPLLKLAYQTIKAADPDSFVLMSGLASGTQENEPSNYLDRMYKAGAKDYFDAANMHPYTFPAMPVPSPDPCQTYNAFCHDLPLMRKVMLDYKDGGKKIWITEFGCPTGTAAGQINPCSDEKLARQLIEAYDQGQAWGWIGPFLVFDWQNDDVDGDFGLYRADGTPKPDALAAFEQIAGVASPTPGAGILSP